MEIQSRSKPDVVRNAAHHETESPVAPLFTVEQFPARQPGFTPAALRNMIFKAAPRQCSKGEVPGNGLIECGAIVRLGRKVLIDEARFLAWIRAQAGVK